MRHFGNCFSDESCCCGDLKRYFLIGLITAAVFLLEFFGSLHSHSLALLSDSFHSLGHILALGVMITIGLLSLTSNKKNQLQNRGSFLNGLIILGTSFYIVYEAMVRFFSPLAILTIPMLRYAIIGLLGNVVTFILQRKTEKNNLNDSFLTCLFYDLHNSILVIVSGIIVFWTGWLFIDLVASFILAGTMIYSSSKIIRDSC